MHKSHQSDMLFCDYKSNIKALQWHSYEVTNLENNNDVTLIASSNTTKYQIFKYKNNAYGIQFHIEIKNDTVSQWGCVPEYEKALNDTLGDGALNKFDAEAKSCMADMNLNAEILYKNFKKIL
jgi:GMP synthase - Glutamine amidotransferase domain